MSAGLTGDELRKILRKVPAGKLDTAFLGRLVSELGVDLSDVEAKAIVQAMGSCRPEDFVSWLFEQETGREKLIKKMKMNAHEFRAWKGQLAEDWPWQGYISLTEHRGVTLAQLKRVVAYMNVHCHAWRDRKGNNVTLDKVNLYTFNTYVILPATLEASCAFVELMTCEAQIPDWFISHWWGEPILEFVKCVEAHSDIRDRTTWKYWVCAYANRQHNLDEELTKDPAGTSFFKAMSLASGVLVILDKEGPATTFTRIWCAYEAYVALLQQQEPRKQRGQAPMELDIATCTERFGAQLLTNSFVEFEADMVSEEPALQDFANVLRHLRQCSFPMNVLKAGLDVRVERALASNEEDRVHILNAIAGRGVEELAESPFPEHENYGRVNVQLSARFAWACWHACTSRGLLRRLEIPKACKQNIFMTTLQFDATSIRDVFEEDAVRCLAESLPTRLETCCINVSRCHKLTDAGLAALAAGLKENLQQLSLDSENCSKLTDAGLAALAAGVKENLQQLSLKVPRASERQTII